MSATSATSGGVAAANQTRQTAKWLIAAFATVGGALIAGVPVSNLGAAHGTRLGFAVTGAALGTLGVLLAIWHASRVLPPVEATVSDLTSSSALRELLQREPTFLGGFPAYTSVGAVIDAYVRSFTAYRQAQTDVWAYPDKPEAAAQVKAAEEKFNELSRIVDFWRGIVIADRVRTAYQRARRWILLGAALAFVGLLTFAYAANPTTHSASSGANATTGARGPAGPPGPRGRRGRQGPRGPRCLRQAGPE